jgi:hypothetical protein
MIFSLHKPEQKGYRDCGLDHLSSGLFYQKAQNYAKCLFRSVSLVRLQIGYVLVIILSNTLKRANLDKISQRVQFIFCVAFNHQNTSMSSFL